MNLSNCCRFPTPRSLSAWPVLVALLISSAVGFSGEIHLAVDRNDVAGVIALLHKNPKLASRKDERGNTPLHFAAAGGHFEIVKILLENGADVNARNSTDLTPLHMAAFSGNPQIVRLLLEKGAHPDAKAYKGLTPSQMATKHGHNNIAGLIRGKYESYASGFFITDDGYLISNNHVIKNCIKVQVITRSGTNDARIIMADETNDLVLLKIDAQSAALPIADSSNVVLGATMATVGFPLPSLEGFLPKLSKGEIDSLSGIQDDPRAFQISLPIQLGNSGGALLDERGNAVGVVFSKINALAVFAATGDLPENVNYAIKSDLVLRLLQAVPEVAGKLKSPNQESEKFLDVVKSGEASTAQIHASIELPWYHAAK